MITHIIFDIDGTLIDEEHILMAQTTAFATVFGDSPSGRQSLIDLFFEANNEAVRLEAAGEQGLKNNIPWYMKYIASHTGSVLSDEVANEVAANWVCAYEQAQDTVLPYEDTYRAIDTLASNGLHLVAASGNTEENRRGVLTRLGLDQVFKEVFAARTVGFQKQDVRFWEHVLDVLTVPAGQIMVVGNQFNDDIWHPHQLGMRTVYIDRQPILKKHFDEVGVEADFTITSLDEILPLLR